MLKKSRQFYLGVFLLLPSLLAHSAEREVPFMPDYRHPEMFREMIEQIRDVHADFAAQKFGSEERSRCDQTYTNLFDRSNFRISVFFGYMNLDDEKNHTADPYESQFLASSLTRRCSPGIALCGFKKEPGSALKYRRLLNARSGREVSVTLSIFSSSVTDQGEINEGPRISEQLSRSAEIEKLYQESLGKDDVVFYAGHARHGTGVGMRPLVEKTSGWYKAMLARPMFFQMKQALERATTPAKVIGMMSCDAEVHYGYMLSESAPNSALLLTRQSTSLYDVPGLVFVGLNSLLMQNCESELQAQLQAATHYIYFPKKWGPPTNYSNRYPRLTNLFAPHYFLVKPDLIYLRKNLSEPEDTIDLDEESEDTSIK